MKHTRYLESGVIQSFQLGYPVVLVAKEGHGKGVRKEYDEHRMVVVMDTSNSIVMGY